MSNYSVKLASFYWLFLPLTKFDLHPSILSMLSNSGWLHQQNEGSKKTLKSTPKNKRKTHIRANCNLRLNMRLAKQGRQPCSDKNKLLLSKLEAFLSIGAAVAHEEKQVIYLMLVVQSLTSLHVELLWTRRWTAHYRDASIKVWVCGC